MTTWRYTARISTPDADFTRPYQYLIDSVVDGLERLEGFLEDRKQEFGDNLRRVTLERWEATVEYYDFGAWKEVKKLRRGKDF